MFGKGRLQLDSIACKAQCIGTSIIILGELFDYPYQTDFLGPSNKNFSGMWSEICSTVSKLNHESPCDSHPKLGVP